MLDYRDFGMLQVLANKLRSPRRMQAMDLLRSANELELLIGRERKLLKEERDGTNSDVSTRTDDWVDGSLFGDGATTEGGLGSVGGVGDQDERGDG